MHLVFDHIFIIPIALSLFAGFRAFRLNWPVPYRLFTLFLLFTLLVEVFALLWKFWLYKQFPVSYKKYNTWIYTLYGIPEYIFYLYFFFAAPAKKFLSKKTAFAVGIIYILWAMANIFFIKSLFAYPTHTLLFASLMMTALTTGYFASLLRNEKLVNLHREPFVWIAIGAFIYHLACIPYFIFFDYLVNNNISLALSLMSIMTILNCIMYSSYTIAFLCRKNFQR